MNKYEYIELFCPDHHQWCLSDGRKGELDSIKTRGGRIYLFHTILNTLGAEGWELATSSNRLIFKRPLEPHD